MGSQDAALLSDEQSSDCCSDLEEHEEVKWNDIPVKWLIQRLEQTKGVPDKRFRKMLKHKDFPIRIPSDLSNNDLKEIITRCNFPMPQYKISKSKLCKMKILIAKVNSQLLS